MYMDDIKVFESKEKELENLIQPVRIYSQDIVMEFAIKKCTKNGKRQMMERRELQMQEKARTLRERKLTNA